VSWRKVAWTILFFPICLGLLGFVALFFVWKLPMLCCERSRAVRFLPYAGLGYYGLVLPLVLVALGLPWWQVVIVDGLFAFSGDWLLPDPFTYLFSPRKRRAVKLAIEHVESGDGPRPIYGIVSVVGSEVGRTIVSVAIDTCTKPPGQRLLAVTVATLAVEELDFEYVSAKRGVRPCR
jgi:hypothetical protein